MRKYSWEGVMQFLQDQVESKEMDIVQERIELDKQLKETDSAIGQLEVQNKELMQRVQGLEATLKQERAKNSRLSQLSSLPLREAPIPDVPELRPRPTHPTNKSHGGLSSDTLPVPKEKGGKLLAEKALTGQKLWRPLATLRAHMDGICDLVFCEDTLVLASASEDCLVKLWDLSRLEEDPIPNLSLRGHTGPITSLTESVRVIYSGGGDGMIWRWAVPEIADVFGPFNSNLGKGWKAHTDSIWKLAHHPSLPLLLSCAADGHVKIWATENETVRSTHAVEGPTTAMWLPFDRSTFVVGQILPKLLLVNAEKGRVTSIQYQDEIVPVRFQVNSLAFGPLSSLIAGGHEDKRIRFFDTRQAACVKEIVGHTDAVTSLVFTPNGQQLVSGGHDGSIRTWDIRKFQCLHEMLAHLKKYDEMVRVVTHHSSQKLLASGGADSIVRLYES